MVEARKRLREVLAEAGGVAGSWRSVGRASPPVQAPWGSAATVESEEIAGVRVSGRLRGSRNAAFADGIQRFVVEGWVGITPVLRAYVAAAVLHRRDRVLAPVGHASEEFIVAAIDRLPDSAVEGLRSTGLPVKDCGVTDR